MTEGFTSSEARSKHTPVEITSVHTPEDSDHMTVQVHWVCEFQFIQEADYKLWVVVFTLYLL